MLIAFCPIAASAFEFKLTSNDLGGDLRATSLLPPLAKPDAKAQDVVAAAQADYARLIGLMYDRGYFAPKVSILIDGREAASLSPLQPMRKIKRVELRVATGAPFVFGKARIAPLPNTAELPEEFVSGGTATTRVMKDTVESAINSWRALGFAKAKLSSQEIIAQHAQAQLDVDIQQITGPRLRFGDLKVRGNKRMRASRVVDIAGLPKDEVFDPEDIDRAAKRLRRSGVFSSVSLSEAETASPEATLDVDALVTEAKLRRFGFGAELSTQDGLSVNGFWLHRNLLGGGERLRISGEATGLGGETGGNDYELVLEFTRPATFSSDTDLYVDAAIARLDEPSFSSDRVSLESGLRWYATPKSEYTYGVGYLAARTQDTFGNRSYKIFTLPASAEFDLRDDPLDAKTGYYAKADLTPFLNLNGTQNGVRGLFDTRAYRSLGMNERVTFALRGQLGFVTGPSLANAPSDMLFYSGGGGTVRGQDYQSLGIDLGGENIVGGKSFLGLSGEARVKTGDKLSVVGFYDAGFIGRSEVLAGANSELHAGAGLGIRYDTGIGPIRLDVAMPVAEPLKASNIKLYIGIGQSF